MWKYLKIKTYKHYNLTSSQTANEIDTAPLYHR